MIGGDQHSSKAENTDGIYITYYKINLKSYFGVSFIGDRSPAVQAGLKLTIYLRKTLNLLLIFLLSTSLALS